MIRSNALFIAVVLSFVIGIFCISLFTSAHLTKIRIQKDQTLNRIDANARSGMRLLLSGEDFIGFNEERRVDLFGEKRDSVYLKRIHWGVFDAGIVRASFKKYSQEKIFLYGYEPDQTSSASLYLADQNRPVSMAGKVLIKGDCFLPKAGIQKGYIEGRAFEGETLVQGKIKHSEATLPKVKEEIVKRLECLLKDSLAYMKAQGYEIETKLEGDTLLHSFSEPTLLIRSSNEIQLSNIYCKGNIIICSSKSITVKSSARLDNIQLYAPYIRIENEYEGRMQAFASDSLSCGKNCTFRFPSVLGLINMDKQKKKELRIGESNTLEGIVFTLTRPEEQKQVVVYIGKQALVEGQVYAQGYVQLDSESKIWGNLAASRLLVQTRTTTFDNFLYNTTLDGTARSSHYVGSEMLACNNKRKIISWLP